MPGIVVLLGSFPNSQIRPRSPVSQGDTNEIAIPALPVVTQIIAANAQRVSTLIINRGSFPIEYAYTSAELTAGEGVQIDPGGSIEVEGGGVNVFVGGVGGATSVQIDDRLG